MALLTIFFFEKKHLHVWLTKKEIWHGFLHPSWQSMNKQTGQTSSFILTFQMMENLLKQKHEYIFLGMKPFPVNASNPGFQYRYFGSDTRSLYRASPTRYTKTNQPVNCLRSNQPNPIFFQKNYRSPEVFPHRVFKLGMVFLGGVQEVIPTKKLMCPRKLKATKQKRLFRS